ESCLARAVAVARRILDRLEVEIAHHRGTDNGKLPTTFDQFAEYGMSRRLVAPAIREAVTLGFVEVTERGRAGNADWRAWPESAVLRPRGNRTRTCP
ncbi:hypothetical protein ABTO49_20345, partial [Acinetobacter baumannii]